MSVQNSSDLNARPFLLGGLSKKKVVTLAQDAAKTAVLATYTLLAKILTGAVSVVAGTNTGDGTCTAAATVVAPTNVKPGNWVLTCLTAVAHGGIFTLKEPGGTVVDVLTMTAGAGVATTFYSNGLTFTLTDGATDFAQGDLFTLTVAAGSGKYVPLKANGKDGTGKVAGIYLGDEIAAATLVAGDVTLEEILVGGCCEIDGGKLASDGDYPAGLTTVLPSGLTVADELAALGIYNTTTVNLSETE